MFPSRHIVGLCLFTSLALSIPARAEVVTQARPDGGPSEARQWTDPPSTKTPFVQSDNRSQDQTSALEARLRQLEERVAIIVQDLKADRGSRAGLDVRAKAALREADDLTAQVHIQQETSLKLIAKTEAVKKRLMAIAQNRDQVGASQDVAAASTSDGTSQRRAGHSSVGAGTAKDNAGKADKLSIAITLSERRAKPARKTAIIYRTANRRPFVLPGALQPIRF